ncbi:MAG: hypothetical protein KDC92_12950 [Bacteroidetes bacterium]|nr:hypothetical protein [Bacteroidota bacterium]
MNEEVQVLGRNVLLNEVQEVEKRNCSSDRKNDVEREFIGKKLEILKNVLELSQDISANQSLCESLSAESLEIDLCNDNKDTLTIYDSLILLNNAITAYRELFANSIASIGDFSLSVSGLSNAYQKGDSAHLKAFLSSPINDCLKDKFVSVEMNGIEKSMLNKDGAVAFKIPKSADRNKILTLKMLKARDTVSVQERVWLPK